MTDEVMRALQQSLEEHAAFSRGGDEFQVTTTPFDARVSVVGGPDDPHVEVTVVVPAIDDVVVGETVASVVQDGWFETLERRLGDVGGVIRGDAGPPDVESTGDGVRVRYRLEGATPGQATTDAKALVDYVEGTYVQGVIPGYEYGPPVDSLLQRAGDRSEGDGRPKL